MGCKNSKCTVRSKKPYISIILAFSQNQLSVLSKWIRRTCKMTFALLYFFTLTILLVWMGYMSPIYSFICPLIRIQLFILYTQYIIFLNIYSFDCILIFIIQKSISINKRRLLLHLSTMLRPDWGDVPLLLLLTLASESNADTKPFLRHWLVGYIVDSKCQLHGIWDHLGNSLWAHTGGII